MNTQKIQAGAQSTKGFTLVELIVVITILVILGTIAFLNIGSFSASARDSRRTSDLNQINSQIMTSQAKSGISYATLVTANSNNNVLSSPLIAGSGATTSEYTAGDINYGAIGIDSKKFSDPVSGVAYKIGQTTLGGGAWEIAAALEDNGKSALVMGIYRARTQASTTSTGSVTSGSTTVTLTSTPANFKVGDWLTATSGTGRITAISGDTKTLTLAAGATLSATASAISLSGTTETTGLIASGTTNPITNGNATYLPY